MKRVSKGTIDRRHFVSRAMEHHGIEIDSRIYDLILMAIHSSTKEAGKVSVKFLEMSSNERSVYLITIGDNKPFIGIYNKNTKAMVTALEEGSHEEKRGDL